MSFVSVCFCFALMWSWQGKKNYLLRITAIIIISEICWTDPHMSTQMGECWNGTEDTSRQLLLLFFRDFYVESYLIKALCLHYNSKRYFHGYTQNVIVICCASALLFKYKYGFLLMVQVQVYYRLCSRNTLQATPTSLFQSLSHNKSLCFLF